jgi:hypothetical protein
MGISVFPVPSAGGVALPPNAIETLDRGYSSTGIYAYTSSITSSGVILNVGADPAMTYVYLANDNDEKGFISQSYGDFSIRLTTTETNFSVFPVVPEVRLTSLDAYYPTALGYGDDVWFLTDLFGDILSSTDGITWTERADFTGQEGKFAVYASDQVTAKYVAGGHGGTLYTSTDAITWTTRTLASATGDNRGLAYGNSVYVLCGASGKIDSSTNGVTWTTRTSGVVSQLNSAAYGANATDKYVVVGLSGVIRSSTDGITWTSRTAGTSTTEWRSVTYGQDKYVTVGTSSQYAVSTNGTTWVRGTFPLASNTYVILSISFGNGIFLAPVGSNVGQMLVSFDTVNWTTVRYPKTDVSYHGQYSLSDGGKIIGATGTAGAFVAQEPSVISLYTTDLTTL